MTSDLIIHDVSKVESFLESLKEGKKDYLVYDCLLRSVRFVISTDDYGNVVKIGIPAQYLLEHPNVLQIDVK